MRIATSIPDVLHICPACEDGLASGHLLCDGCLAKGRNYLDMVRDGVIDPGNDEDYPDLPGAVRQFQDELAPLLTLPGIAPELGAPVERVRCERDVISTPYRGNGFVNLLWMLGASLFAGSILAVLGVYQLWHDFRSE
jgi:hypothetical protein